MASAALNDERVTELLARARGSLAIDERETVLGELVALHAQLESSDQAAAQQLRQAFLMALVNIPDALDNESFRRFIAEKLKPEDFSAIEWSTVDEVIAIAELFYDPRFQSEMHSDSLHDYVRALTHNALQHFERAGHLEKKVQLFQRAPIPTMMMDTELLLMRNRLYLYEMRRVRHKRRLLYGYLTFQAVLVLLVFPLLFVQFENGEVARAIEQSTALDLQDEAGQQLTYADGLYWAIITAASIGYGDVTPVTSGGKVLAALLGTMGVLTIGVVSGLILNWITPRSLD